MKALANHYPQPKAGLVSAGPPADVGKFANAFQRHFVRRLVRNEFPTLQRSGSKGCHVYVNGEGKVYVRSPRFLPRHFSALITVSGTISIGRCARDIGKVRLLRTNGLLSLRKKQR
jgi:RNase P protein component